jgi:hypothetical protein
MSKLFLAEIAGLIKSKTSEGDADVVTTGQRKEN